MTADDDRTNRLLDRLGWALIYGGLIMLIVGVVLHRDGAGLGWIVGVVGGFLAMDGAVLLWVRSRRSRPPAP